MRKYKIRCKSKGVYYTETVDGEPIDLLDGYEFFLRDDGLLWGVTEVSTGYLVAAAPDRETAIKKAKFNLTEYRQLFIDQVKTKVEENKVLFSELL